jgi:hypothetical protein
MIAAILEFMAAAEEVLETVKKVARHVENMAMYGPSYYALQASKGVKEWFENSEMAKALNLSLGSQFSGPWGAIQYWEDVQRAINNSNLALGIGGQVAKNMRDDLIKSKSSLLGLNLDIENFTASYGTFVEEYGRPFAPSNMDIRNMATINKAFQGQFDSLIPIAKLYGRSIEDTRQFINDAVIKSDKYGVSVNKVISNIQKNIQMIDKYTFKGGLEGLKKMSIEAQRLNLTMNSVVQFSEKFYNPEDAIEMAASLQMMGGEFAQFGDVFQLMYDANNDVGSLINKVAELTKGMGMLNKQTGEIEFTSLERRQLKYFETVSGIPVEEMMRTRRVQKQEEIVKRYISPELAAGTKEDLEGYVNKIAMLAEFKGGIPKITIDNKQKLVSELSKEDLDSLSTVGLNPLKDPIENLVDVNITATQKLQDIYKQIVILSNDFKLLNATELAAAAQAEFAKKSTAVEAASMMENTAKMKAVASAMAVGEVGASSGFGGIGDWFNGLNLGYSGGLSGANIPSASSGIGGMVDTADLKKVNTGEQKFSTFKDIKNDKEKVVQLVNEYFRQYTAVKEYGKMENQQVFFEGKGGSIDLTLNGEVFKTFELSKDKDFQEAYRKQFNEAILSTKDNGGKNTSPNPPY